jgi:endonuclease I
VRVARYKCRVLLYCRVLLQRIAKILTAPPKEIKHIEHYEELRNLMRSLHHNNPIKEREILRKNKLLKERLRNTAPYYRVQEWEDDYHRQVRPSTLLSFIPSRSLLPSPLHLTASSSLFL